MAKDRRDSKNRILQKGEYQKADGRYMYRFTKPDGSSGFVYSWTLNSSDRTPKGKEPGLSLRELKQRIERDLSDGIDFVAAQKITLNEFFDSYMALKIGLKENTRQAYRHQYDRYVRKTFGRMRLSDIKYSDVKSFYFSLIGGDGKRIATVKQLNAILSPVFNVAVRDDLIRKNPTKGVTSEIKRELEYRTEDRNALSRSQQTNLLTFIKGHRIYRKWYTLFVFLLGTGCRIGEAVAVTWDDCDFENNEISIYKSLHYIPDEYTSKSKLIMSSPKTRAGVRKVPMFPEVRDVLLEEKRRQMKDDFCKTEIGEYKGFVFSGMDRTVMLERPFYGAIQRIVEAYNKEEAVIAAKEKRAANLMPEICPHTLRHTFCTRMCESGMNPKVIQEVMGHANISITMNVYNNMTDDFRKESFETIKKVYKIV